MGPGDRGRGGGIAGRYALGESVRKRAEGFRGRADRRQREKADEEWSQVAAAQGHDDLRFGWTIKWASGARPACGEGGRRRFGPS